MPEETKQFVYIAGRGHSGSTMLDAMLGNAPQIESVGELLSGMSRYDDLCSCGQSFKNCSYWAKIRNEFENQSEASWDEAAERLNKQAHIRSYLSTLRARPGSDSVTRLINYNRLIAKSVCGDSNTTIVDSSKEITRALFLLRFHPEAKIIHLVKNPVQILESDYKRLKEGSGFKFLRRRFQPQKIFAPFLAINAFAWLLGNMLAEKARKKEPDRFLQIRYEDLAENPEREFKRLEEFLGHELRTISSSISKGEPFAIGHNIGGNHMRLKKEFVFDPSRGMRSNLPNRYRRLAQFICRPLLKKYGYL